MRRLLVLMLCLVTVSGFCEGYGAYKDAVRIQETNPFNPNAVKSFVYHIFDQNWVLVDACGRLKIKEYLVKEVK